ncbi:MAG: chemotaxis protein CheA [Pseudomonadota bacterium]
MSDPMAEIKASFFVECEELLEALQDGLQAMEDGATDSETINVVFRAVHSIKGGAGAFSLDQLVGFAHAFETTLDAVRSGDVAPSGDIIALFFQCGDLLSDLVRAARDETLLDEATLAPVLARLSDLVEEDGDYAEAEAAFQATALSIDLMDLGAPEPAATTYTIKFAPEPELYSSGNEPLYLLRTLQEMGTAVIRCDSTQVPPLDTYDPAKSYLRWTIEIETTTDEPAIREVFEFVDGLCSLTIAADPGTADVSEPSPSADLDPLPEVDPPVETQVVPEEPEIEPERPSAPGPDPAAAERAPETTAKPTAAAPKATVRVDLERIDRLVNLVGELVINQAMLSQSLGEAALSGNSQIAAGLDEFQQLTRDIQDSVMMIRAQPVKSLFQRMSRIVREAAADVGKKVRLKTEGEATEIDKTVIERLADPLTHMIRNAVDHGLESSETRVASGKPAEGTVVLSASHRSGRVVIEISDDGGGINRPKVRSIAEDRGLISSSQVLSDSEIDNLLFLPGFSTASEVSNLSGRGVGMDVVKNAISALGGRITIVSEPGQGTTFSISLPLTLAVLDGMVVRVGTETLVIPLSAISETLSLKAEDCRTLGPTTQVVQVRESFVPLLDLGTELGYTNPRTTYENAIVLLIAQEDGARAALVVDSIEDQRQVVIKGLQDSYGHVPGVAAATILGDGQIALILDPTDLLANAQGHSRPEPALAEMA